MVTKVVYGRDEEGNLISEKVTEDGLVTFWRVKEAGAWRVKVGGVKEGGITQEDIKQTDIRDPAGTTGVVTDFVAGEKVRETEFQPSTTIPAEAAIGRGGTRKTIPLDIMVTEFEEGRAVRTGEGTGELEITSSRVPPSLREIAYPKRKAAGELEVRRKDTGELAILRIDDPSDVLALAKQSAELGILQTREITPAKQTELVDLLITKRSLETRGEGAIQVTRPFADISLGLVKMGGKVETFIQDKLIVSPNIAGKFTKEMMSGFAAAPFRIAAIPFGAVAGAEATIREPALAAEAVIFSASLAVFSFKTDPVRAIGQAAGTALFIKGAQFTIGKVTGAISSKYRTQTYRPLEPGTTITLVEPTKGGVKFVSQSETRGIVISELPGGIARREFPLIVEVFSRGKAQPGVGAVLSFAEKEGFVATGSIKAISRLLAPEGRIISVTTTAGFDLFTRGDVSFIGTTLPGGQVLRFGTFDAISTVKLGVSRTAEIVTTQKFITMAGAGDFLAVTETVGAGAAGRAVKAISFRGLTLGGGKIGARAAIEQPGIGVLPGQFTTQIVKSTTSPLLSVVTEKVITKATTETVGAVAVSLDVAAAESVVASAGIAGAVVPLLTTDVKARPEQTAALDVSAALRVSDILATDKKQAPVTTAKLKTELVVSQLLQLDDITKSKTRQKVTPDTILDISSLLATAVKTDVVTETKQDLITITKARAFSPFIPTSLIFDYGGAPPGVPMLGFDLSPSRTKKKKKIIRAGIMPRYAPSFEAVAFNIKGIMPTKLTGLELRPII